MLATDTNRTVIAAEGDGPGSRNGKSAVMFAPVIHDEASHDAAKAYEVPGLSIPMQVARTHGRAVAFNSAEDCPRTLLRLAVASEFHR